MNYWEVSLMDCQIKITDNKAVWKIQAALALIFLLNPFLGVLSTLFFVFVSKEKYLLQKHQINALQKHNSFVPLTPIIQKNDST